MGAVFVALDFLAAIRELLANHISSEDASAIDSYIPQFLWLARRAARDCTFSVAQGAILDGPGAAFRKENQAASQQLQQISPVRCDTVLRRRRGTRTAVP
jgi:hypothetical protein